MTQLAAAWEWAAPMPTEEDIAFYESNGYYISPLGTIPEELIERALSGAERFYRGERDTELPVRTGYCNAAVTDQHTPRNHEFVSLQMRELRELATYPVLGAMAARLARCRQIRLLDDQLIWKPSHRTEEACGITGWHADLAYWGTCSSDRLLTAWIPLHDVTIDRSPLVVIAGSHRWDDQKELRQFNSQNLDAQVDQYRREGRQVELVPMTLQRGQVSFHHGWTVHASLPNTSGWPRLALAVHLQDGDNRYRSRCDAHGRSIHIADEEFCRKLLNGDPDFSDPKIFPVLWNGPNACA